MPTLVKEFYFSDPFCASGSTEIQIARGIPDSRSSSANVSCATANSIKGAPGFDQIQSLVRRDPKWPSNVMFFSTYRRSDALVVRPRCLWQNPMWEKNCKYIGQHRAVVIPANGVVFSILVLYMAGKESPQSALGVARLLTGALPRVEVVEFDGLGHMGPTTHSQQANQVIARFLASKVHPQRRYSMTREIIYTTEVVAPPPTYSQVVKSAGLIFVFGSGPYDAKTGAIVGNTLQEQTSQCLANISAVLTAAGSSLSKVVSATVILLEEADFPGMNDEWVKWFPRDPTAHGAGRLQCQRGPAQPELQAHSATVDRVGGARPFCHEGLPAAVHVDRSMPGRPSARAHRAGNAKTTAQTRPLVEGAARPGSPICREAWSCVQDKV